MQYDVVIIGAGLAGLVAGVLLCDEGYSVCIIEKNEQIGGNLQTFRRDGITFDTGVHYVGGLGEGQNLYHIFKYLGLIEKLKIEKMDEHCFDAIIFKDDNTVYPYGMGYTNFKNQLYQLFPTEKNAIDNYCKKMKDVCNEFPFYNFKNIDYLQNSDIYTQSAQQIINSFTENKKLQAVLAGNNLLYAGNNNKTPFYVHALVVNSYIEGAYKIENGGDSIAKILARKIKEKGGKIIKNEKVVAIDCSENIIEKIHTDKNKIYSAKHFISNIPPALTLALTKGDNLKPAFKNRIKNIENTVAAFSVYISLNENKIKYKNTNYYYFDDENVWDKTTYTSDNWPNTYAVYYNNGLRKNEYADSITIIAYMKFEEVAEWQNTYSTHDKKNDRGVSYENFKKEKAAILLEKVREKFPELTDDAIKNIYASTPLTYRDYIGTADGNLYGIQRDCNEPLRTNILPMSKISNLFFAGQNINLHGVFGVTVSGIIGAACILGKNYLFNKIINAKESI